MGRISGVREARSEGRWEKCSQAYWYGTDRSNFLPKNLLPKINREKSSWTSFGDKWGEEERKNPYEVRTSNSWLNPITAAGRCLNDVAVVSRLNQGPLG